MGHLEWITGFSRRIRNEFVPWWQRVAAVAAAASVAAGPFPVCNNQGLSRFVGKRLTRRGSIPGLVDKVIEPAGAESFADAGQVTSLNYPQ